MTAEDFLKTNGCEHDGSFVPVSEVIRLMEVFAANQVAEFRAKMPSEEYSDRDIDIAYLTGVFVICGIDGLGEEIKRLRNINKMPHDLFRNHMEESK